MKDIEKNKELPLLKVYNLGISFFKKEEGVFKNVVPCISFNIYKGKTLAVVGRSGSGKTITAMALLRLLPYKFSKIIADKIEINEYRDGALKKIDLNTNDLTSLYKVRGRKVGVVFQDPMLALNPVHKVFKQISEVFELHRKDLSKKEYEKEALSLLEEVGIKDTKNILKSYPHQLSGGMRQRVVIAIAIAANPILLIADEPTTSLDVLVQDKILKLLKKLQKERGMGMLFITHDFNVLKRIADDVLVMKEGVVIEAAKKDDIFKNPLHEYTKKLIDDSGVNINY